jgi:hypothetical protein
MRPKVVTKGLENLVRAFGEIEVYMPLHEMRRVCQRIHERICSRILVFVPGQPAIGL